MKVNDSGMPEETYWNSMFDIPLIIDWLDLKSISGPIAEIGCGYGTFTLPIAEETGETVYAFDIEPSMIETTQRKIHCANIHNVRLVHRDIIDQGSGLESESVGMVLLFNILHFSERRVMIEESYRILRPSGVLAIIHWRKDIQTPRGPALHLRPDQNSILYSTVELDLSIHGNSRILEPFHWGIQFIKGKKK